MIRCTMCGASVPTGSQFTVMDLERGTLVRDVCKSCATELQGGRSATQLTRRTNPSSGDFAVGGSVGVVVGLLVVIAAIIGLIVWVAA